MPLFKLDESSAAFQNRSFEFVHKVLVVCVNKL